METQRYSPGSCSSATLRVTSTVACCWPLPLPLSSRVSFGSRPLGPSSPAYFRRRKMALTWATPSSSRRTMGTRITSSIEYVSSSTRSRGIATSCKDSAREYASNSARRDKLWPVLRGLILAINRVGSCKTRHTKVTPSLTLFCGLRSTYYLVLVCAGCFGEAHDRVYDPLAVDLARGEHTPAARRDAQPVPAWMIPAGFAA